MSFLLDTNALSEPQRPRPNTNFLDWLAAESAINLHTSVLVFGELKRGVFALPQGARRSAIEVWLRDAQAAFGPRILPVNSDVAEVWARLTLSLRSTGANIGLIDELIAATALAHDLIVVTRNARHFEPAGCRLVSPWSET